MSYIKTPVEVIERIVHAVSMGGNMVVNFGPMANGDFRPEEKELAKAMGQWMKTNGEAIYGCDYAGWKKQSWGYYTRKDNDVYMVVFNRPYSGKLVVQTPKGTKVVKATLLDGKEVNLTETTRNEYNVESAFPDPNEPYVIKLQIDEAEDAANKYREALT